jgi:vacuolar-type H+-ATPase subunit C/Vma6
MNIEIMRNTLYKAYLEDFYRFCQVSLPTRRIMKSLSGIYEVLPFALFL